MFMNNKYNKLFEQWKEKRAAPIQEWGNWYYNTISLEEQIIADSWEIVYNYAYGTGYLDKTKEVDG